MGVRAWIRSPLVHFLLAGSLAFVAFGRAPRPAAPTPIPIDEAVVEALGREFEQRIGRAPTRAEWHRAVRDYADEEMLVREALALGLVEGDPVVVRRIARNRDFVRMAGARQGDEVVRTMHARDPVVRRRLVQRLRRALEASAGNSRAMSAVPASHEEPPGVPARYRFAHVLFARDVRGERVEADARAALATLSSSARTRTAAPFPGDPSVLAREQAAQSVHTAGGSFGEDFAAALPALPVGRWAGPVPSSLGAHLVRVHERLPAIPASSEARARAHEFAQREHARDAAFAEALQALRKRYEPVYALPGSSSP